MATVVVLGGGVSGLAAAYYLQRNASKIGKVRPSVFFCFFGCECCVNMVCCRDGKGLALFML